MKICLLGAQGTGKTTLANLFNDEYMIIDGVARRCISEGCRSNEGGDASSQRKIYNSYLKALDEEDFISTRSVLDVLAYTSYLAHKTQDQELVSTAMEQQKMTVSWLTRNPDVIFCYIPVEFDPVYDGVRSINKEYQHSIDEEMKNIIETLRVPVYEIRGDVQERELQLRELIKKILQYGVKDNRISFN